jgi:hypothetical protein
MSLKKLIDLFDEDMLPFFGFERFLFDCMSPGDRKALQAAKDDVGRPACGIVG